MVGYIEMLEEKLREITPYFALETIAPREDEEALGADVTTGIITR